jgi:hypothetical protein
MGMSNELKTTDLPKLAASAKTVTLLEKLLPELNRLTAESQVPNPEYVVVKERLSRVVEYVREFGMNSDPLWDRMNSFAYAHELHYYQPNHVAGKIKLALKLQKKAKVEDLKAGLHSSYPARGGYADAPELLQLFIEVSNELQTLFEAVEALRPKIVKRKVKTDAEKEEDFWKPLPAEGAIGRVATVLTNMTNPLTDAYAEHLHKQMIEAVEHEIANRRMRGDKRPVERTWGETLLGKVGDDWDSANGSYRKLEPNYKKTLKVEAENEAKMVQRSYLWKNLDKLTLILDGKGNLKGMPTILNASVSARGFMGEVKFEFEDGSYFTCRNQVIVNRSEYGKYFNQFPTTFHDVKLPNGMLMKKPSEKTMVEDFAGVKTYSK